MNELSLYILDIMENSVHADAKLAELIIDEEVKDNLLTIDVTDDGRGMDKEILKRVYNPFYTTRTTRKVGLGIPLFKEQCELCGGHLIIESTVGKGTHLTGTMKLDSVDLLPMGNIVDTILTLAMNEMNVDIKYTHIRNGKRFIFDTREIKKVLNNVPINTPDVVIWMKEYIRENLNNIN